MVQCVGSVGVPRGFDTLGQNCVRRMSTDEHYPCISSIICIYTNLILFMQVRVDE